MMIENLSSKFNIDDINVVVGYKKNLIMESFPSLSYIYNPFFDSTNTSKSLLMALKKNIDSDILWLNGDVIFDLRILDMIEKKIEDGFSFISVNTNRVAEEEVKYTLKNGFVNKLSKSLNNGLGEAVGINYINLNDIKELVYRLEECDNNDYFEKGLELAITKDNLKLKTLDISIDNTISIFEVIKAHKNPIISESGIKSEQDAKYIFEKTGIKNFLIGESLLKSDKPQELMKKLIQIYQ